MFGARGPLREGEGDKAGGTVPPPTDPPPTPPPAPAPQPIVFTPEQQAHIDRLVGSARKEGRDSAIKQQPPALAPQPPPQAPPAATVEALQQQMADMQMRNEFDRLFVRSGIADDAEQDVFDLYKSQKPTDKQAWFETKKKTFGAKQSQTETTTTVITAPNGTPNTPPISDKGSPAPSGVVGWRLELAQNPIGMSAAARQQMNAELGEDKARKQRLEASKGQADRTRVNWKG